MCGCYRLSSGAILAQSFLWLSTALEMIMEPVDCTSLFEAASGDAPFVDVAVPVVAPDEVPAIADNGFVTAEPRYMSQSKDGAPTFSIAACVLRSPLHPDGPLVFCRLADVFYDLGFATSTELHRHMRRPDVKRRVAELCESLGLTFDWHYRHSRKQARIINPDIDEQTFLGMHDVDAMASSSFIVLFLLSKQSSTVSDVRRNALKILQTLCALYVDETPCFEIEIAQLEACHSSHRNEHGYCSHFAKLAERMRRSFGDNWANPKNVAEVMWIAFQDTAKCVTMLDWRLNVFDFIVGKIDQGISGAASAPSGVRVLKGASRLRRLSRFAVLCKGFSVSRPSGSVGHGVLQETTSGPSVQRSFRGPQLANYQYRLTSIFGPCKQLCLSIDCTDTHHEIMTIAAGTFLGPDSAVRARPIVGWLPVKVISTKIPTNLMCR